MSARPSRIFAFLAFGLALLVSAAHLNTDTPSAKELDFLCSQTAEEHGVANPSSWVWSAAKAHCVKVAQPESSDADVTQATSEDNSLNPRANCAEGNLDACLDLCSSNKSRSKFGGPGQNIGCRSSCSVRCSGDEGGCYKGYCWAGCGTGFPGLSGLEWCYTTKSYSQSYQYVTCSSDDQCDLSWACGGPCAAF